VSELVVLVTVTTPVVVPTVSQVLLLDTKVVVRETWQSVTPSKLP
jgi:hypothetical protein